MQQSPEEMQAALDALIVERDTLLGLLEALSEELEDKREAAKRQHERGNQISTETMRQAVQLKRAQIRLGRLQTELEQMEAMYNAAAAALEAANVEIEKRDQEIKRLRGLGMGE